VYTAVSSRSQDAIKTAEAAGGCLHRWTCAGPVRAPGSGCGSLGLPATRCIPHYQRLGPGSFGRAHGGGCFFPRHVLLALLQLVYSSNASRLGACRIPCTAIQGALDPGQQHSQSASGACSSVAAYLHDIVQLLTPFPPWQLMCIDISAGHATAEQIRRQPQPLLPDSSSRQRQWCCHGVGAAAMVWPVQRSDGLQQSTCTADARCTQVSAATPACCTRYGLCVYSTQHPWRSFCLSGCSGSPSPVWYSTAMQTFPCSR